LYCWIPTNLIGDIGQNGSKGLLPITIKVFEAQDAETGLAICQSEQVYCVIMELHLPDISPFQVLMLLNPTTRRCLPIPLVALSHFILSSIIEAAQNLAHSPSSLSLMHPMMI